MEWNTRDEPSFRVVEVLGNFSLDENHEFLPNDSRKRFLRLPESMDHLDVDLNEGFETAVRRNTSERRRLPFLLRWILQNRDVLRLHSAEEDSPHFVTTNSTLCTIATTRLQYKDWVIHATKFKGVIYMTTVYSEYYSMKRRQDTEIQHQQFYWKKKFCRYMTDDEDKHGLNKNGMFSIVLKSQLNSHHFLHSAEVGAEDTEIQESGTHQYVNLAIWGRQRIYNTCPLKDIPWSLLPRFWAEAYFSGVPKILWGIYCAENGILQEIVPCEIPELPKLPKNPWTPEDVITACDSILSYIKEKVVEENPRITYVFSRKWKSEVIECRETKELLLPDWYTSAFEE